MNGRVASLNLSNGGVPKLPAQRIEVRTAGIVGDRQNDLRHHGGPERAVSIFSLEVIERLRDEGHLIDPGAAGENVTLAGIDWSQVAPGGRFIFDGGVELEVASFCAPCKTIRAAFKDESFGRISQKLHPGESRVYARVITEGEIASDAAVEYRAAD